MLSLPIGGARRWCNGFRGIELRNSYSFTQRPRYPGGSWVFVFGDRSPRSLHGLRVCGPQIRAGPGCLARAAAKPRPGREIAPGRNTRCGRVGREKDGAGSAAGSGARRVRTSLACGCDVGARGGGEGAGSPGSGARRVRTSLASDVNRKSSVTLTRWRAESLAHFEGQPKTLLFYD